MKIGLIGFGSIGKRHYENLLKHTKNIVVFSHRKDLKKIKRVNNWRAYEAAGPYDIIFITNETYKHIETIKKCLRLKPKAIFVEKPLSHNLNGLARLAAEVKKKKISLYVGYNFHFFPPYIYIKNLIDAGSLGQIYYLRASVGQDLRQWRARDYRLNYSAKRRQGGGVLLDLVHDINYPAWVLGEKLVPQAAVVRKLSNLAIDTEDCAESLFMTKNKTIVSVHQDYLRIPLRTSIEIIGSKGSLLWDSISQTVVVQSKRGEQRKKIATQRNDMFVSEIKFFLGKVRSGKFFTNLPEAIADMNIISNLKKYAQ